MELFNIKNNKVENVDLKSFKLEKEIQDLVEKNTETFFQLEFVRSEFPIGDFRVDTLCFDNENNSFVIIEYKRGSSYSVIDQGYSYLSLMLNKKNDFIIEYNEVLGRNLKRSDVDWSQSRIIFVSQSFNSYQKNSVNFKNLPFELWEIKRFSNNTIVLNKHKSDSKESIESLSNSKEKTIINSVSKEVKVYDEDSHTNKLVEEMNNKWDEIKEKFNDLDNVELVPKKTYMSLMLNNKTVSFFHFRKQKIMIDLSRGTVLTDGTTSKNYFTIDDSKNISKEGFWEWKSGTKGTYYRIPFTKTSDVDYIMFLIKQKYKNIIQ